jgi:pyruvate dehydrogenase E2 component (dihydrolipoamide acetyltransferase)
MAEITMPRLSDTMSEGAVGKWLKKPGDTIASGDVIAEIETDKATMDLEAFENGTLQKILVPEGKTVPVGEPIAIIGDGAVEAAPEPAAEPAKAAPEATAAPASAAQPAPDKASDKETAQPATQPQAQPATPSADGDRIKASPVAKRLAAERGIDLSQV